MALVTDGILTQKLPWGLVLIGVFLTIAIELMGLQSLPIAVGRLSARSPPRPRCSPAGRCAGWWSAGSRRRSARIAGGGVGAGRAVLQRAHRRRRASPGSPSPASPRSWSPGPSGAGARGRLPGSRGRACSGCWAASRPATWRRSWCSPAGRRALPRRQPLDGRRRAGLARDQRPDHPRCAGARRDAVLAGRLVRRPSQADADLCAARPAGALHRALSGERACSSAPPCTPPAGSPAGRRAIPGRLVAGQPGQGHRDLGPGRGARAAGHGRLPADPRLSRPARHLHRPPAVRELPTQPAG